MENKRVERKTIIEDVFSNIIIDVLNQFELEYECIDTGTIRTINFFRGKMSCEIIIKPTNISDYDLGSPAYVACFTGKSLKTRCLSNIRPNKIIETENINYYYSQTWFKVFSLIKEILIENNLYNYRHSNKVFYNKYCDSDCRANEKIIKKMHNVKEMSTINLNSYRLKKNIYINRYNYCKKQNIDVSSLESIISTIGLIEEKFNKK